MSALDDLKKSLADVTDAINNAVAVLRSGSVSAADIEAVAAALETQAAALTSALPATPPAPPVGA